MEMDYISLIFHALVVIIGFCIGSALMNAFMKIQRDKIKNKIVGDKFTFDESIEKKE